MAKLTSEQQAAAYAPCSVVITAGAGTGKTHMLSERYLYYVRERNLSPLQIVAVTFTEKAATELRSRIRALLSRELPERLDLLAELEAAQISTIHALGARVCQEHFQELNIPPDFEVLDELEGKIWFEEALRTALSYLAPEIFELIPYSLLQQCLKTLLNDPYTANLALQQGVQDWSQLLAQARLQAVEQIKQDPAWESTPRLLEEHQGAAGDKLETIRQDVLTAIADLNQGNNIQQAISTIDGVNLRVGSKKNWSDIKLVKDSLKELREAVRWVTSQGLIDWELSEADEQLKQMLPALTEAYRKVSTYLSQQKLQRRVLTFNDLELYALKALTSPKVQQYYQQRWQVFLVDEFQDTNPTQAAILSALTTQAELTIVGDIKQSIYGFRRADVNIFHQFRDRILSNGGKEVVLSKSFRTHNALITHLNQIFAPLLQADHQDLNAFRQEAPTKEQAPAYPSTQVLVIGDPPKAEDGSSQPKPNRSQRQRVEAEVLASKIQQILAQQVPVFDKQTQEQRPIEPKDIAILTRTWQPLEIYSAALAAKSIPVAPAGGGNLLATREAKDAIALLRFLAHPQDDIALVALLRSPFFAISDRVLFQCRESFAQQQSEAPEDSSWWSSIQDCKLPELKYPLETLHKLLQASTLELPSRLLKIADRWLGYTAVIANLPGAERRLADWQGFCRLVQELEQGTYDLFGVVRRLRALVEQDVAVPRPVLGVGNAISLMTIYASKGLEWGLVIVADLSKERPKSYPVLHLDSHSGVGVKSKDAQGLWQKPVLYSWLEYCQEQKERAEAIRVLYVALTRARDYLILSAAEPYKGELNRLQKGLAAAQIAPTTIPYQAEQSLSPTPSLSDLPETLPPLLLQDMGSGLTELPVTALTDYLRCPARFKFRYLEGHPGLGEGLAYGMQIGTLVHKALEHNIVRSQDLKPFASGDWDESIFSDVIALAARFFKLPIYQQFRETAIAKEQQISWQLGQLTFNGVIDLVGDDWVLDYKSDRQMQPEEHRLQLWVYAQALSHSQAHIAYLRHDRIHSFNPTQLRNIAQEAEAAARKIHQGKYVATPTLEKCAYCPYLPCCNEAEI